MRRGYAPILVSVYHRLYTLKRCIAALSANEEAKDTVLYVVSDGAANKEDAPKIAAVREYLHGISGFKEIRLIERPENWGAHRCCAEAFAEVMERHGRVIRLEDDILVSRYFLRFMNDALDFYKENKRVYAICGYKANFKLPKTYVPDAFVLNRFSPWGFATWKNRIDLRYSGEFGFKDRREAYDRYGEFKREMPKEFAWLEQNDPIFLQILKCDSEGKIKANDVRNEYYLQRAGCVCVYPRQTMAQVMPTGKDAMHATIRWQADERLSSMANFDFRSVPMIPDSAIYDAFVYSKHVPLWRRAIHAFLHEGFSNAFTYYCDRMFGCFKRNHLGGE